MFNFDANEVFIPPLRLVLTHKCNGRCKFCHREGFFSDGDMTICDVDECSRIADKIGIPNISLTGGEPTIHPNLVEIIKLIQSNFNGKLSLTSNGFNLNTVGQRVTEAIDYLNLSITSFNKDINSRYQSVDPSQALSSFLNFPAKNKNLNVVVVEENYQSIEDFISYCVANRVSLDIMFELKNSYISKDKEILRYVVERINKIGKPIIKLGVTPSYLTNLNCYTTIRIKHPSLSSLIERKICVECREINQCFERVCAVRVYPDKIVSSCLSKRRAFNQGNLSERITNAYKQFEFDVPVMGIFK